MIGDLIKVKANLGLVAYIGEFGGKLVNVDDDNVFTFESDKTEREWEMQYGNSCCTRHDSRVMAYRKFMSKRGQ